jgi:uncharacterized protein YdaU (DUF1376 family)
VTDPKSPAFQFYVKDWRSSQRVSRMSFKERGMYLELLIEQWDKGPLPLTVPALAASIGAKLTEFAKCWPILKTCFLQTPEGYLNERLERERLKQQMRRQRASDSGKEGARQTWGRHSTRNGVAMPARESGHSFSIASASASASAGASAPASARSKRPIFTGQRVTVFEWMLDELVRLLGPHLDAFDLHEWFFTLDAKCVTDNVIPPPRDNGAWLKAECLSEAQRRGIPLRMAAGAEDEAAQLAALGRKGPSVRP